MKKAIFTLILFLAVSLVMSAQTYKITRQAVGTGGFVSKTTAAGKMSGLFGQAITGKINPIIDGKEHTMYLGFWSPIVNGTGIDEELILQKGIYNYPNPVVDITNFNFSLSEPSLVTIKVYNTLGSLVAVVTNEEMCDEGINSIPWNSRITGIMNTDSYQYEMIAVPVNSLSKAKPISYKNVMVIVAK